MPIGLLAEILAAKPANARLLAMDIGTKTIGLALSDSAQRIATPFKTIARTKFTKDILELEKVISDYDIGGYVLGFPLNMDGSEGGRAQAVRHFADEMLNYPQIFGKNPWISLWDERLSSWAVENFLIETVDMSRERRAQVVDKLAAQHILSGALSFIQQTVIPDK